MHHRRIQYAGLVHHVPVLDAAGLDDELFRGVLHRFHLTGGDGLGILGIHPVGIGVEGGDQFGVGDDIWRRKDSGAGDGGSEHGGFLEIWDLLKMQAIA